LFFPSHPYVTPLAEERRRRYGSTFIHLDIVASKNHKIMRNSGKNWPYSSSRSSGFRPEPELNSGTALVRAIWIITNWKQQKSV